MNCGPWIWAAAFSILPRFGLPANTTRVYTKPKKVSIFFNRGGEQYTLVCLCQLLSFSGDHNTHEGGSVELVQ